MDTRLLNPEEELEEIKVEGWWFIPSEAGNEPKKVPGILYFRPTGIGRLELMGVFSDARLGYTSYPVIFGEGFDNSKITIFDSVTGGMYGSPPYWRMSITFNSCWIGEECHYTSKDQIAFDTFAVGINRLRAWSAQNGFDIKSREDADKRVISYSPPQPVLMFSDAKVSIRIAYWWTDSGLSVVQDRALIQDFPRLTIKSNSGKISYVGETDTYNYYIDMISSFLGLLIGDHVFTFDYRGGNRKHISLENDKELTFVSTIRHYHSREIVCKHGEDRDYFTVDIKLGSVLPCLKYVVEKFNDIYKRERLHIDKIARILRSKESYDLELLKELMFVWTGIAEDLYSQEAAQVLSEHIRNATTDDDIKRQEAVFLKIADDESLVGWLEKKLGKKRGPSFAMYIRATLNSIKDACPCFRDQGFVSKMVRYCQIARLAGAHALKKEETILQHDVELQAYMISFVLYVLRVLILYKCDLKVDIIRESLMADFCSYKFYENKVVKGLSSFIF